MAKSEQLSNGIIVCLIETLRHLEALVQSMQAKIGKTLAYACVCKPY